MWACCLYVYILSYSLIVFASNMNATGQDPLRNTLY